MKYLCVLPCLVLTSCETFAAAAELAKDPEVMAAGAKVVTQAVAGEWYGAAYSAAGLASLLVGRWIHGRMKKSEPGSIIG